MLSLHHQVTVYETTQAGEGIELTQVAIREAPDVLLAAGGDGTLNQVVNGIIRIGSKIPIAVAPLGTGNDFASYCDIKNAQDLIDRLSKPALATDVGEVTGKNQDGEPTTRFFMNVSSIGLGPDVVHRLESSSRLLGADLTYLLNSVRAFLGQVPFSVKLKAEDWEWEGMIRVVAIANGVRFGSGLHIAPGAQIDDGEFSAVIAGDVPFYEFLFFLIQIKNGNRIHHPKAQYHTCKSITVEGPPKTWIETDGELACMLPAIFKVLPSRIKFFR